MCKEDYCSYEQSKKLKELGFDWECSHLYDEDKELIKYDSHQEFYDEQLYSDCIPAPTMSQAQKWLREKGIEVMSYYDYTTKTWIFEVCEIGDPHFYGYHSDDFGLNKPSYEQALSSGIDKALELLKEQ